MHVAICDDHVADRKQLERLLARESDARLSTTGNLYVDSYGNSEALKKTPMFYDLFFIDMTEEVENGFQIANILRAMGVTAPIVLCSLQIDYKTLDIFPHQYLHLEKPIRTVNLSQVITDALTMKMSLRPTIELRDQLETYYVYEEDILYAVGEKNNTVTVYLRNYSTVHIAGSLYNFYDNLEETYPDFCCIGKRIINTAQMKQISPRSILFSNDDTIPLQFGEKHAIQKYMKSIR